jgi:hypothetical protein
MSAAPACTLPQSDRRSAIVPKSKAAAKTDLQATTLNPFASQAVAGGQQVTFLFTFETGRNPDLPGLLDAIETFYGAGKLSAENDVVARAIVRLRVAA